MISRQRLTPLLKRACMDIYGWRTGVVRTTPDPLRAISVSSSCDRAWGDCIALNVARPDLGKGYWEEFIFSPARARLIAEQLLARAEHIEKTQGARNIDTVTLTFPEN